MYNFCFNCMRKQINYAHTYIKIINKHILFFMSKYKQYKNRVIK